MRDSQYKKLKFSVSEIEHAYGDRVHILADPYLLLGLSILCASETKQPHLHYWIGRLYRGLLQVAINGSVEKTLIRRPTRMQAAHPEAVLEAIVPDPQSRVVVVNLARAGTVPSFVCYDELNYFFEPAGVRQDHIILNRQTDALGQVVGSAVGGSKIGGDIDGAYVLVPDPMGATGSTLSQAYELYRSRGAARRWIAMHLIVTPEYLRRVRKECPDLDVYALRLDRGLSSERALAARPGAHWDEERGLNGHQYIVPGAGGLGEILNNTLI